MSLSWSRFPFQVFLALTVLVLVAFAPFAVAQPADPGNRPEHAGPPQDVVDKLLGLGFRQAQPSIFEREVDGQPFSYETVVYGVDGHIWLLGQQEAFLETLEARYEEFPAVELLDAIDAQEQRIADTRARLEAMMAEVESTSGASLSGGLTAVRLGGEEVIAIAEATTCTTTLSRAGDAGPGSTGPIASGSASFSDTCTETGTVSATSVAQGTTSAGNLVTYTDTCPSATGGDVSCSTAATVDAVSDCFSSGQGDVTFGSLTYTVSQSNNACQDFSATLSGSTSIFVPSGSTGFGSWSVSVSGGTPPYNYQWFFNNAPVGTNSVSYSRSFSHPGYDGVYFYTVKVTVTDSSSPSQVVTKSLSVRVEYEDIFICVDPCFCQTTPTATGWSSVNILVDPCHLLK